MVFAGVARFFTSYRLLLIGLLLAFPASAQSVVNAFSFVEFNIAFALGLSLPILLIIVMVKPTPAISRRYPILLSASLLAMLYSLAYLEQSQYWLLLSFSGLFLSCHYFWSAHHAVSVTPRFKLLLNVAVLLGYVVFIYLLWSAAVAVNLLWLSFAGGVLVAALLNRLLMVKGTAKYGRRVLIQWAIILGLIVCIYLWLLKDINTVILVSACVVSYLAAITNGCWQVISTLVERSQSLALHSKQRTASANFTHDPTTNLPGYQQALVKMNYWLKNEPQGNYAVIVFKPTNFTQVNEVLGHRNSDILLLQLAYCLQKSIERDDELVNFSSAEAPIRIARLQGLHFLLLMDTSKSKHDDVLLIEQLIRKLTAAVPGPMSFKSFSLYFELAFGVAFVGQYSGVINEVIAFAEDALLVAEKEGKSLSFFDQGYAYFNEQQLLKMEKLKRDIQQDKLYWYGQPQIKLESKEVIGFEMQVAWQDENDEILPLEQFVELAEHSGDLYALTQKMLAQAFSFLAKLQSAQCFSKVAVKLSSIDLLEHDLVEFIEVQAKSSRVEPQYLVIEIKEKVILKASQRAKAIVDQLRSLGIDIAIDDFSGSYESLRYLRRLSISQIKIDCMQLAHAEAGSSDKTIIDALITLTRKMDLPLIGTSINNETIEHMFNALGGEFAQGDYFKPSGNIDELLIWLNAWQQQYPSSMTE